MKRAWVLLLLIGIGSAQAAETRFFLPSSLLMHAEISGFLPKNARVESVFSASEQEFLAQAGKGSLARALRVQASDFSMLESAISSGHVRGELERQGTAQIQSVSSQQWGLRNRGESFPISIDDLTTLQFPGTAGEDIGLDRTRAEKPGAKIRVAILDTGVDLTHPDLKDRLVRNETECTKKSELEVCVRESNREACLKKPEFADLDTNRNGYPLDCNGFNFTGGTDPEVKDEIGHGTHVAGVVASVSRNVELLTVKVVAQAPNGPVRPQDLPDDQTGATGFVDRIARGVLYAIRNQARVLNLSMAWPMAADSELMRQMVDLAQARGILVVAAAGNDSTVARVVPCVYPGVVCVGAHSPDGKLSHFSNFGSGVDVLSPGYMILSAWPRNKTPVVYTEGLGYEFRNGTSMATPFAVGILARLLATGMGPDEARARLILGARTSAASRESIAGNTDLARALEVTPEPLILPLEKRPLQVEWDMERGTTLPVELTLKNYFKDATAVRLRAKSLNSEAQLLQSEWDLSALAGGKNARVATELKISGTRAPGEIQVEWTVESAESGTRSFVTSVDLKRVIRGSSAPTEGEVRLPVRGGAIDARAQLRTITPMDGRLETDYLAISKGAEKWTLQLIREKSGEARISSPVEIEALTGDLLVLHRVNLDLQGESEYVIVTKHPPKEGERTPIFRLNAYDSEFRPLPGESIEYDNDRTVLLDRFQWMRWQDSRGVRMVPAWVGLGHEPKVPGAPRDPWDPEPAEELNLRLYLLTRDGLRANTLPKGEAYVDLLSATREDQSAGRVRALVASGYDPDEENIAYRVFELIGSLDPRSQSQIDLRQHRVLMGIDQVRAALSLDRSSTSGTAFNGVGARGVQRTTLVRDGVTRDGRLRSDRVTDPVVGLSGVFADTTRFEAFGVTQYRVVFTDFNTGERVFTSRRRFSFLPALISARTFFPVVGEDASGMRQPGLWATADLGALDTLEILVPERTPEGLRLLSPARFRLEAREGCSLMGNPIPADEQAPARAVLFCGDHFRRIPVRF